MANIKSADKRWRQSLKRRLRNRSVRTAARTLVRSANRSISAGEPDADALKTAVRALDKAAEKGIIHPNNAARRKSRLMRHFAVATSGTVAAVAEKPARSRASSASRSRSTAAKSAATRTRAPRSRTPKA